MEQFQTYKRFADYLIEQGWIKESYERDLVPALAAFENVQRRRGALAARIAMDKAAREAW